MKVCLKVEVNFLEDCSALEVFVTVLMAAISDRAGGQKRGWIACSVVNEVELCESHSETLIGLVASLVIANSG